MNTKLVCHIQPFLSKQEVHIYEDNNEVDSFIAETSKIVDTILTFARNNNIIDVTLAGSKVYNQGVKHKIENQELIQYNENKIKVTVF